MSKSLTPREKIDPSRMGDADAKAQRADDQREFWTSPSYQRAKVDAALLKRSPVSPVYGQDVNLPAEKPMTKPKPLSARSLSKR